MSEPRTLTLHVFRVMIQDLASGQCWWAVPDPPFQGRWEPVTFVAFNAAKAWIDATLRGDGLCAWVVPWQTLTGDGVFDVRPHA